MYLRLPGMLFTYNHWCLGCLLQVSSFIKSLKPILHVLMAAQYVIYLLLSGSNGKSFTKGHLRFEYDDIKSTKRDDQIRKLFSIASHQQLSKLNKISFKSPHHHNSQLKRQASGIPLPMPKYEYIYHEQSLCDIMFMNQDKSILIVLSMYRMNCLNDSQTRIGGKFVDKI